MPHEANSRQMNHGWAGRGACLVRGVGLRRGLEASSSFLESGDQSAPRNWTIRNSSASPPRRQVRRPIWPRGDGGTMSLHRVKVVQAFSVNFSPGG